MSITDELRQVAAKTEEANGRCGKLYRGDLDHIADRIDAEHNELLRNAYEDIASDEFLEGHGWVRLPVDADGVPIHVGDKMEFCAFDIEHPVIRTVDGIGKDVFFAWCGERGYQQHDAKRYRHHHPPTVEDVLDEFANAVLGCGVTEDEIQRVIAEYAKRLRLAGEDE